MIHTSVGGDFQATSSKFEGNSSTFPPAYQGNGVLVHGIVENLRNHSINANGKYHRFLAIELDCTFIRNRTFNAKGEELETAVGKEKAQGKGFLNHFDKKEIDDPEKLTSDQWLKKLGGKPIPAGLFDGRALSPLHPQGKNKFEFWADVTLAKPLELKIGDEVRLKTKGDGIFVDNIAKYDLKASNYSGENVKDTWNDKLQSSKDRIAHKESKPLPGEDKQGVDESEWD